MGNEIANGWRAVGLDHLVHTVDRFATTRVSNREIVVEIAAHAADPDPRSDSSATRFDLTYVYRVLASGDILLQHTIVPRGEQPNRLPKVGLQMLLRDEFDNLRWNGRGPFETYPDRKTGARIGVFQTTVNEDYEPYLVPEDYGNKSDVRWVSLANAHGVGLFASGEQPLDVSAQHFSTDNLARAWYPPQLVRQQGITLNLDHRVSGVGGTAISVLQPYWVLPQPYTYSVRLRPYSGGESPTELARQAFW